VPAADPKQFHSDESVQTISSDRSPRPAPSWRSPGLLTQWRAVFQPDLPAYLFVPYQFPDLVLIPKLSSEALSQVAEHICGLA
jgi:hypothetical protein